MASGAQRKLSNVFVSLAIELAAESRTLCFVHNLLHSREQIHTSVRDKKVVQKVGNLRLFLYLCK